MRGHQQQISTKPLAYRCARAGPETHLLSNEWCGQANSECVVCIDAHCHGYHTDSVGNADAAQKEWHHACCLHTRLRPPWTLPGAVACIRAPSAALIDPPVRLHRVLKHVSSARAANTDVNTAVYKCVWRCNTKFRSTPLLKCCARDFELNLVSLMVHRTSATLARAPCAWAAY
eukprot:SAG31_NODE_471_length_15238_cov_14.684554_10_plen_174_part_00